MEKKTQLPNVFLKGITNISNRVALKNYLNCAWGNWDNAVAQIADRDKGGNNDIDDTVEGRGRNTEFDSE